MLGFKQIDVWVLAFENFNEKQCKKAKGKSKTSTNAVYNIYSQTTVKGNSIPYIVWLI